MGIDGALLATVALVLAGLAAACAGLSYRAWRRAIANQRPGRDVRTADAATRRRDLAGFFTATGRAHLKVSAAWGRLAVSGVVVAMLVGAVSMLLA